VPTNIITGFLGAGKTTVILELLKQKPEHERWAILVNEFGEIGVDGSLIQGQHGEEQQVFIKEVPGGCMCCAAGLPMQIALNQLLTRAKPDRLLIEPTGLGHPKEILAVLSAQHYHNVLSIEQCITLVDARKLDDTRYTEHETFNQQIDVADHIIGHKADLYQANNQQTLIDYIAQRRGQHVPVSFAENGRVNPAVLIGPSKVVTEATYHHHMHTTDAIPVQEQAIPEAGFLKVDNKGEGYQSEGWRFSPDKIFSRPALHRWLLGLKEQRVERAKGVFITHDGIFGYNLTQEDITEVELDDCIESRIEIIVFAKKAHENANEAGLLSCITE